MYFKYYHSQVGYFKMYFKYNWSCICISHFC